MAYELDMNNNIWNVERERSLGRQSTKPVSLRIIFMQSVLIELKEISPDYVEIMTIQLMSEMLY